ncbi:MAG: hypothetical protein Q8K85_20810 [Hyphomicrobium sp.]|nr:hypothetical protein [Hyphomicrobium sp.]
MKRNERLDAAIRDAIETAGCLDEEQLAASVARALRKEGMLSITAQSVIAYLEVHGADILGPPVQATQLEVDFVHIQQRLANRIGAAEGDRLPQVLTRGLAAEDPVAVALGAWLQQNPAQEFKISDELLSLLRAAEAKLLQ